jgi:hypothetical protein
MTRHVCLVTTASRGRRRSVSPEGDRMNKTKRFHGWMAMRSMRGGFISRSRGPLQKVCHDPARRSMSGHNCLPGPQTVCFPGGRPHEQNEEVPRMDGSAGSMRSSPSDVDFIGTASSYPQSLAHPAGIIRLPRRHHCSWPVILLLSLQESRSRSRSRYIYFSNAS